MIIFQDGTYIELLNWIGKPVEFFDWAGKNPGLIDFALTSSTQSAQETHAAVTRDLEESSPSAGDGGLGVRFKEPLHGGRKRKDGQMVEWYVTKPRFDHGDTDDNNAESSKVTRSPPPPLDPKNFVNGRLDTPFFCHDVTDRSLRVPYAEPDIAQHPSGAKGILSVEVVVPREHLASYARLYASVTGVEPTVNEEEEGGNEGRVHLRLASPDEKALEAVHDRVGVVLRAPSGEGDEEWIRERGVGIRALNIHVPGLKDETRLDGTGIGSSVVLVG